MSEANVRFPSESVSFACPRCGARQVATVRTILDTREPGAREAVLSGRFHQAVCTGCGARNGVPTPFLFHDAPTESAFLLVPALGAARDSEERAIGQLTNRLLESLPPAERRMYILSPRSFLTDISFIDAVVATTGATPEMLESSRNRVRLVEKLLRSNELGAREALLEAAGEDPRNLSGVAAAMAEDARSAEDLYRAEALDRLARSLAEPADGAPTTSELITALDEARTQGVLDDATAALRPLLDYAFFAALTASMEAAAPADAARLTTLRADVVSAIDRTDAAAQTELDGAVARLRAVLAAADPIAELGDDPDALSPAFFFVLAANISAAREQGASDVAARLEAVHEAAVTIAQAALPPRDRLASRLARAPSELERSRLLSEAHDLLDADLGSDLRNAALDARSAGAEDVASNLEAAADLVDLMRSPAGVGS